MAKKKKENPVTESTEAAPHRHVTAHLACASVEATKVRFTLHDPEAVSHFVPGETYEVEFHLEPLPSGDSNAPAGEGE